MTCIHSEKYGCVPQSDLTAVYTMSLAAKVIGMVTHRKYVAIACYCSRLPDMLKVGKCM